MDDVEEEAPGHRRRRALAAEELEAPGPLLGWQRLPPLEDRGALLLVRLGYRLHRRRHRRRRPLRLAGLERLDDHLFLADDLPGDLLRCARLRIRFVVGVL